ncbi:MAG TPA: hypothetical protein PLT92_14125 [Ignavibacteriaceae bacterium]|nr:hypothetical protein [Ignavibacteriaceae bacterium]
MIGQNLIEQDQINIYKKLIGDDEKYNYYFTNKTDGEDLSRDSLFYKSYLQLNVRLTEEIKSEYYNTLILLVGFSVQPLVLSISILKPNKVYLLFSNETKQNCSTIMKWTKKFYTLGEIANEVKFAGCDSWHNIDCKYLINSSDPDDTYKKILDIVNNEKINGPIAIDITGGKKTMVSGAFIAASMTGTDALYVDFGDYDGNNPVPGTEDIKLQKNPITEFVSRISKIFSNIQSGQWISKKDLNENYKTLADQLVKLNLLQINSQNSEEGYKPYPYKNEAK